MRAIVLASTALVLATQAQAYDPVADTRKIMAATVTTKSIQTEYLTGKRDGTTINDLILRSSGAKETRPFSDVQTSLRLK